jgi:hypothetical protein
MKLVFLIDIKETIASPLPMSSGREASFPRRDGFDYDGRIA